ncbi:GNAT family N-acetyltransferase, partial [Actinospica durhamensis]
DAGGPGFAAREVRTPEQWADFVDVLCSCWDPPRPVMHDFLRRARFAALAPGSCGRFLVGYVEEVPVCTAEALLYADVAVLYNIVTLPDRQCRGYGTAITVAALELAREAGYRVAALQASAQGEPVYRRLGFEQVGQYMLYGFGG